MICQIDIKPTSQSFFFLFSFSNREVFRYLVFQTNRLTMMFPKFSLNAPICLTPLTTRAKEKDYHRISKVFSRLPVHANKLTQFVRDANKV